MPGLEIAILASLLVSSGAHDEDRQSSPKDGSMRSESDDVATEIVALSESLRKAMVGVSWHPGCPVALDDLRLVRVPYRGFDRETHRGELVVHERLAVEVGEIFQELYAADFGIERMDRIDLFQGDDDKSMAANNTSSFNCRSIAGQPGVFSRHAFGDAIDVNPLTNPYVRKGRVDPPGGSAYLDRTQKLPGLIAIGGPAHQAFIQRGWVWGGAWRSLKDYQHFEKRPNKAQKPPRGSEPGGHAKGSTATGK